MANKQVLLREDIDNLGARGEIVRVKAGYARNYLLPRNLAVEATASNVKQIEGPVIVQVVTKKGKGWQIAEEDATKWHGPGAFDYKTGTIKRFSNCIAAARLGGSRSARPKNIKVARRLARKMNTPLPPTRHHAQKED